MKKTLATAAVLLLTASLSACGAGNEPENAGAAPSPEGNKEHTVVYEVTSDAEVASTISFVTESSTAKAERVDNPPLPFTREIKDTNTGEYDTVYRVSPGPAEGATSLSCKITVDGEVMAEETSKDPLSPPVCLALPDYLGGK